VWWAKGGVFDFVVVVNRGWIVRFGSVGIMHSRTLGSSSTPTMVLQHSPLLARCSRGKGKSWILEVMMVNYSSGLWAPRGQFRLNNGWIEATRRPSARTLSPQLAELPRGEFYPPANTHRPPYLEIPWTLGPGRSRDGKPSLLTLIQLPLELSYLYKAP
jgi:hypothetical protein